MKPHSHFLSIPFMAACLYSISFLPLSPAWAQEVPPSDNSLAAPPAPLLQRAEEPEKDMAPPAAKPAVKRTTGGSPQLLGVKSSTDVKISSKELEEVEHALSLSAMPALSPPSMPPGKSKDFAAALASVYANHPQLKAQREAQEALDEGVAQALSGFRPSISAQYSKGRQRTDLNDSGWDYGDTSTRGVNIVQPLFNGGGTLASLESAKRRVKAGRAQLTAVEQQVIMNAVLAYTDVIHKRLLYDANRANVGSLEQQLEGTNERFKAGELTKTDASQSQTRLAIAQAGLRQARGALLESQVTFRRVIGYNPPDTLELPPTPSTLPRTLDETLQLAQLAEPSLEAARQLELALDSDINVNKAALLPAVNLEGTMDRSYGTSIFGPRRINNDQVKLNVVIPIYQSGAEWSRVRAVKDQAQQQRFTTLDTQYGVIETAARTWENYFTTRDVVATSRQTVQVAEGAVEGMRKESLYGARTVLDVLNTEQDLFFARVNLINAMVNEKQQAYRLLASVGRLTARDLGLNIPLEDPKKHYKDVRFQPIGF
jgi:outer membrane protein